VHDIGKVAAPDTILLKPARLTRSEQLILWRPSVIGERICSPLKSFQMVLPIIRHVHEKMNGSGYPDGLQGEEIPITARVLTIVDVYDALTTEPPYKKALGADKRRPQPQTRAHCDKRELALFPKSQVASKGTHHTFRYNSPHAEAR